MNSIRLITCTFFVFVACLGNVDQIIAQKALQFEKRSSLNTSKFYIGDEVRFRINGSKIWYTRMIHDINLNQQTILIVNLNDDTPIHLPIKDITHIQVGNRNKVGQILGQTLFVGGFNTVLTSVALNRNNFIPSFRDDPAPLIYGFGGSAVGFALWKLFSRNQIKLNDRKRLRLIDTTLYLNPA